MLSLPIVDKFLRFVVVLTVSPAKLYAEDELKIWQKKHWDLARIPYSQESYCWLDASNKINSILLRYNSLPCETECFTGCREELRPMSKKKRHLFLAVASGCRHVICPLCYNFSRWSPPSYNLWKVFTAFFFLYLSAVLLSNVPIYVVHLLLYKAHSGQFSALPLL